MKLKYILSSISFLGMTYYSYCHPEEYPVLVTVLMGSVCILLIAALAVDRKEK